MELSVLETAGIPTSGIISIRAGQTRRQAQITELERPFRFPQKPQDVSSFKIDVLNAIGNARVAVNGAPRKEYAVELETETEEPMSVKFAVRSLCEAGTDDGAGTVVSDTASATQTLNFSQMDLNGDGIVTKEEYQKAVEDSKAAWRQKRETSATKYLEAHGLVSFMQFLMQSLMKDKPIDPYAFLQKQVAMRRAQAAFESQDSAAGELIREASAEARNGFSVTVEELASLEREAAENGESLRADNGRLRDAAAELRTQYDRLMEESDRLVADTLQEMRQSDDSLTFIEKREKATAFPGGSPEADAFRDIARVQEEVTGLCRENSQLVAELARMRCALEASRAAEAGAGGIAGEVR